MSLRDELIQTAAVAVAMVTAMDQGSTLLEYDGWVDTPASVKAFDDVLEERYRQEAKWGTRDADDLYAWLMILIEEVGEACDEVDLVNRIDEPKRLRLAKQTIVGVSQAGRDAQRWLEGSDE